MDVAFLTQTLQYLPSTTTIIHYTNTTPSYTQHPYHLTCLAAGGEAVREVKCGRFWQLFQPSVRSIDGSSTIANIAHFYHIRVRYTSLLPSTPFTDYSLTKIIKEMRIFTYISRRSELQIKYLNKNGGLWWRLRTAALSPFRAHSLDPYSSCQ